MLAGSTQVYQFPERVGRMKAFLSRVRCSFAPMLAREHAMASLRTAPRAMLSIEHYVDENRRLVSRRPTVNSKFSVSTV